MHRFLRTPRRTTRGGRVRGHRGENHRRWNPSRGANQGLTRGFRIRERFNVIIIYLWISTGPKRSGGESSVVQLECVGPVSALWDGMTREASGTRQSLPRERSAGPWPTGNAPPCAGIGANRETGHPPRPRALRARGLHGADSGETSHGQHDGQAASFASSARITSCCIPKKAKHHDGHGTDCASSSLKSKSETNWKDEERRPLENDTRIRSPENRLPPRNKGPNPLSASGQ